MSNKRFILDILFFLTGSMTGGLLAMDKIGLSIIMFFIFILIASISENIK